MRELAWYIIYNNFQPTFEDFLLTESYFCIHPEAATRCVLLKKVFLEFSQNSQENTYACNFIKKEALTQVFSCEFREISKNICFTEHLWETATICHQNIQRCLTKIHKDLHKILRNIYCDLFIRTTQNSNLRSRPELQIYSIRIKLKEENSLIYHDYVLWSNIPHKISNWLDLSAFSAKN